MFNNLKENEVYTIKLNSGEELITRIKEVLATHITISEPVSIAPGPQGMGLMPSMFTANPAGEFRINTNSIAMIAETEYNVKNKYSEAISGIKVPDKKILVG